MAGTYNDVPGVRIPYNLDGSMVKIAATVANSDTTISGGWSVIANGDVSNMVDGSNSSNYLISLGSYSGKMISVAFAQSVNITGHNVLVINSGSAGAPSLYYSTDTTDGTDGTWSASQPSNQDTVLSAASFRNITAVNWVGVKGVRLFTAYNSNSSGTVNVVEFGLYGTWTPATLAGWHPTLDQQIGGADLDFGDIALGTVHTKTFRIKNGRGLQANTVTVSSTIGETQTRSGLLFSDDNTNWATSIVVTSIAAGAISPVLYVKRTVGAGETPSLNGTAEISFIAGSWT